MWLRSYYKKGGVGERGGAGGVRNKKKEKKEKSEALKTNEQEQKMIRNNFPIKTKEQEEQL